MFPTQVGVIPSYLYPLHMRKSVPHASRGDPKVDAMTDAQASCSPRKWGLPDKRGCKTASFLSVKQKNKLYLKVKQETLGYSLFFYFYLNTLFLAQFNIQKFRFAPHPQRHRSELLQK